MWFITNTDLSINDMTLGIYDMIETSFLWDNVIGGLCSEIFMKINKLKIIAITRKIKPHGVCI